MSASRDEGWVKMEGGRGRETGRTRQVEVSTDFPNMGRQPRNLGHRGLLETTRAATHPLPTLCLDVCMVAPTPQGSAHM